MPKYSEFLIDLDGTITDSGYAIMSSAQYALSKLGYDHQPEEILRKFVGPSLMDSFQNLYGMTEDQAREAVKLYREIYETDRMFEVTLYPRVEDILKKNREMGFRNILVTSKPHIFAARILEKLGLDHYFAYQTGPEMKDPSSEKVRLIRKAMEELSLDSENCVMIGDTKFDIIGANEAGIDSVGVTYGYGTREELVENRATYLVDDLYAWFEENVWWRIP